MRFIPHFQTSKRIFSGKNLELKSLFFYNFRFESCNY
jgi:hypothetical protein